MVEIFGRIERNIIRNGNQVTTFIIPAFSERLARRRTRANIRLKNLENADIDSIEPLESGDIPGQTLFEVTVISSRV